MLANGLATLAVSAVWPMREMTRIQLAVVHAAQEDARSEVAHIVDIQHIVGSMAY